MNELNRILQGGLYSVDETSKGFRWSGCDVCRERTGKRLGNDVYEAKGYLDLEAARGGKEYYDFNVCHGCLCAVANGDPWPEEME